MCDVLLKIVLIINSIAGQNDECFNKGISVNSIILNWEGDATLHPIGNLHLRESANPNLNGDVNLRRVT